VLRSLSSFLASFLTFVDETRTQVVVTYVTSTLLYTDTVGEVRGGGFRPFTAKTLRVVVMSESRVPRGIENTQGAQNETKDEKSTHMPARVRQVFCDEFSAALVGGGVVVYNSGYLPKYEQERQCAPPQNGLATHLFGDIMKDEIFGTVIITNYSDFY